SVCLCRSTAGTPDRLGAKGFQPASPRSPPGRGLLQLGQDQSAVVGAPPRCERVSAGKPAFAPGAGAPTVGGQDQSAFVGAPHRRERVSAGKPTFAPEAGAPTVGGPDQGACAGAAPRCARVSARKRTYAAEAGAPTVGGQDQSAFVGAPPRCERVSADEPAFAPGAGAPTIRRASVGAPPGRDRLGAMRCQPAGRPAAKALEVILDESVG